MTGHDDSVFLRAGNGSWLHLKGVDFAKGAATFTLCASSEKGGAVKVTAGTLTGEPLCMAAVPAGQGMTEITVEMASFTGETDLYLAFAGDVTASWWQVAAE